MQVTAKQLPVTETHGDILMQSQLQGCDGEGDVGGFKSGYCNKRGIKNRSKNQFSKYTAEITQ